LIQWTLETVRQLPLRSIRVSGISRIHCLKGVPVLIHLWVMKKAIPLFTVSGISRVRCLKGLLALIHLRGVLALIHLWVMKKAVPLFTVSGISRIHCLKGVIALIHLWLMKSAVPLFTVSGISRIYCLKGVPALRHLRGVLIQWTLETVRQLPPPTVRQEVASVSTIWLRSDTLILVLPGP